eukprot:g7776.t1
MHKDMTTPQKGDGRLSLIVRSQIGEEAFLRILPTTPLSKLMGAYCQKAGKPIENVRFLFHGVVLNPNQTAAEVEIVDGSLIDAIVHASSFDIEVEGYNASWFVGEVDQSLICAICQGVLREAVQAAPAAKDDDRCGHMFCGPCVQRWLSRTPSCPECREPLTLQDCNPDKRVRRQVREHKVHCHVDHTRCDATGHCYASLTLFSLMLRSR